MKRRLYSAGYIAFIDLFDTRLGRMYLESEELEQIGRNQYSVLNTISFLDTAYDGTA